MEIVNVEVFLIVWYVVMLLLMIISFFCVDVLVLIDICCFGDRLFMDLFVFVLF